MDELDWEWVRSFVAVAEAGSMRLAAERTGTSQPTLSRHVQKLEEVLGLPLFDRPGRGLALTPRGTALYESAARVRSAMDTFQRQAMGLGEEVAGSVRLTASLWMGLELLPPWLAAFRQRAPHITVDLVLDDDELNLLTREAEVAIRLFRPAQLDLVSRLCGILEIGYFASPSYLARRGTPLTRADLASHDRIGFDRSRIAIDAAARNGRRLTREEHIFRCDATPGQLAAARAGVGVVAAYTCIPDTPELVRILPDVVVFRQEVWLVAHPEVHHNPRIRTLWRDLGDFLAARLATGAAPASDG